MDSHVIEPNLVAAENYTESFFVKLPVDATKNRVCIEEIGPVTALRDLKGGSIVFSFPYKEFPYR